MTLWIIDFVAGLILAFLFYGLVRLRMYIAPLMRDRYGAWARWTAWGMIGALMVIGANLMLVILRLIHRDSLSLVAPFFHELLFATIAFGGGFFMVAWHTTRQRRRDTNADSDEVR